MYNIPPVVFDVGVDPNICLIAVHARHSDVDIPGGWFNTFLKKQDAFKAASLWETYVISECIATVSKLEEVIEDYAKKNGISDYIVNCSVEQQRGRVKTICEVGMATAGLEAGWRVNVPSPVTWKKKIGLPYGKGNADNKLQAEKRNLPRLTAYCKKHNMPKYIQDNKERIHDLCDARCLSEYSEKCREGAVVVAGTND